MLKPEVFITLNPCNPGDIETLDVKLTFEKEECGGLATFQILGRLHREMDAVYDLDPKYAPMALNYFSNSFL
ncbi:hypothetical protein [Pseudomonas viridiflava]|uniref:hypothetical protein n=1 Tax=Pseudomonas viridiflava TaxID=33069 RepID=UPI000F02B2F2|nr:hypothetical protein [Pseudomonas viridiflava]